LFIVWR